MEKSIYSGEYATFLRHLRNSRQSRGLTQQEIGARLEASQSFVSKCERGERRIDVVETRAFCAAIGIDFVEFVTQVHERLLADSAGRISR